MSSRVSRNTGGTSSNDDSEVEGSKFVAGMVLITVMGAALFVLGFALICVFCCGDPKTMLDFQTLTTYGPLGGKLVIAEFSPTGDVDHQTFYLGVLRL